MKITFTLYLIFISLITFSQATYNLSDHGTVGYSMNLSSTTSNLSSFDFSQTGANHSWNYVTLGVESNAPQSILNPDNTGYKVPFITACTFSTGNPFSCNSKWGNLTDIARLELDSLATPFLTVYDLTSLMSLKNNVLVTNIQGAKVADSGSIIVPITSEFTEKDTVFVFPLNYQDSNTSFGKWGVDLNSVGRDIQLKVSFTRSYVVEGWGQLITPYKAHNSVIKVKTIIDEVDSLYYSGFGFGIPRKMVQYTWLDPAYGIPVMEAFGQIDLLNNEIITEVKFLDSASIGVYENNFTSFSLFPNPANDIVTIKSGDNVEFNKIKVFNTLGKVVLEQNISLNKTKIDITSLNKGTYVVGIYYTSTALGFSKLLKE